MPLASLPMYDLPEASAATDGWWQGLATAFARAGVRDVPGRLVRGVGLPAHWLAPDLLFSQTCGYPLTDALSGRVGLLATPCYGADGTAGPDYCSFVVVAAGNDASQLGDLRGGVCAVNGTDSQSGYNALRALLAPLAQDGRFCRSVEISGSHRASLRMVATGAADFAAIDCVTWALVARHRPAEIAGVRQLLRTQAVPGLPYITAGTADADRRRRLVDGLRLAFADPGLAETRAALLLEGMAELPLSRYAPIPEMRRAAEQAGYPMLQ
jgi:ABC-type phosphate/phosphonate transport system substrate-binding protein